MPRILLVDDNTDFLEASATVLLAAGFAVVCAAHYVEALDALEFGRPPDLLLTDIVMPAGINGIALALLCRQRIQGLKVIFITGYGPPRISSLAVKDKVLFKPIEPALLVAEVRLALGGDGPQGRSVA
jgi:CheY-like chemotaxis protein